MNTELLLLGERERARKKEREKERERERGYSPRVNRARNQQNTPLEIITHHKYIQTYQTSNKTLGSDA